MAPRKSKAKVEPELPTEQLESPSPTETQVRVDVKPEQVLSPSDEQSKQDNAAILRENMELLRKIEVATSQVLEANQARERLEKILQSEREKAKSPGGYRKYRRRVLGLHLLFSALMIIAGPVLWYQHLASPDVCFLILPGILWFSIITAIIYNLADIDSRYGE